MYIIMSPFAELISNKANFVSYFVNIRTLNYVRADEYTLPSL